MGRIKSVDLFRLLAIVAVMAIHTQPFAPDDLGKDFHPGQAGWVINQLARFAVPFFFIISGYFWALKQAGTGQPAVASFAMARRIGVILLAWSLIYLLPFDVITMAQMGPSGPLKVAYWNASSLLRDPLLVLSKSTKPHLWFLIALLWSLAIAAVFSMAGRFKTLWAFAVALFVISLLGKAYSESPFGWSSPYDLRNGPFFGTIFFVTGALLTKANADATWLFKGAFVLVVGIILQAGETWWLWRQYGSFPFPDFTVGTFFMGLGVSMAALSNHRWLQSERLSAIGKYTLGIYAVHYVYVDVFSQVGDYWKSPVWELSYLAAVFLCSVVTVLLMARSPLLRKIVS